jgi:hypothetical protein
MRWRVQLGINSTSDVWKFCQNWTSRRGELVNLALFINLMFKFRFSKNCSFTTGSVEHRYDTGIIQLLC